MVVLVVVFSFVLMKIIFSFVLYSFLYFFSVVGSLGRLVAGSLGLKIFQSIDHFFVPFVCDGSCCSGSDELCG